MRDQIRILGQMLRSAGSHRRTTWFSLVLLAIILATSYMQVVLNNWNVPFYNSVEQRNLSEFWTQLRNFGLIAIILLVLNVGQAWLQLRIAIELRQGISLDLIRQWLNEKRGEPLWVTLDSSYPDQRIHLDARSLADSTTGLAIGFVQSTILLISFIGILWGVSDGFKLTLGGHFIPLPGYMVWAAIVYSLIASAMSWVVGRDLASISAERESQEGAFRAALKNVSDTMGTGATAATRVQQKDRLEGDLNRVLYAAWKIALSQTNLTWVSAGFGWLALVVPILVAAPMYFAGSLNFGGLMMAAGAFTQVHSALRWYVNNFPNIAQWQANLGRVTAFRKSMTDYDSFA